MTIVFVIVLLVIGFVAALNLKLPRTYRAEPSRQRSSGDFRKIFRAHTRDDANGTKTIIRDATPRSDR